MEEGTVLVGHNASAPGSLVAPAGAGTVGMGGGRGGGARGRVVGGTVLFTPIRVVQVNRGQVHLIFRLVEFSTYRLFDSLQEGMRC